ncbi:MAG: hypothetical protein O2878_08005 [Bacteroidetes bacterium]|jgi:hypothetical protein|nr:hypothetical protein [Bacteroidota bacterium]MDA0937052.1 hypothetical protein [Bacteroidota bacterium]
MNLKNTWRLIVGAVFICSVLQFSPWALAQNKLEPYLFGMPFTLWFGILITLLLILLTAVGGYVFARLKSDEIKEE